MINLGLSDSVSMSKKTIPSPWAEIVKRKVKRIKHLRGRQKSQSRNPKILAPDDSRYRARVASGVRNANVKKNLGGMNGEGGGGRPSPNRYTVQI